MCDIIRVENNNERKLNNAFPYDIAILQDEDIKNELIAVHEHKKRKYVQVGPEKYFFPYRFKKEAEYYYNFEVRPDDLWIVTFPRSGTTLTQEMMWLLTNDLDFETATKIPLSTRFPFLEFTVFLEEEIEPNFEKEIERINDEIAKQYTRDIYKATTVLEETPGRRFIKTHIPLSLLPPNLLQSGCKVVYVARNPKDVAVSFYHLSRLFKSLGYLGNFEKYWNLFQNNLEPWTPYWSHIEEAWKKRNEKNFLFLFYEDIISNLPETIRQMSDFLGTSLPQEGLVKLVDHLQFDNFRQNKSVNYDLLQESDILRGGEAEFIRRGKVNGWEEYFSEKLNRQADVWIEENMRKIDIKFPLFSVK